ncbi:MAG: CopG family transcriptional regulator [Betaproteobacteria bacterium]|nr:CopG family transcriptional regulator [Betaproteobacteria bacterium]MBK8919025.1 CopG family transcriptional regulator [Betaproteobacteria bacterium]
MENRTARLTLLIDPVKKRLFEEICAAQDLTPSQVVRRLIRQYVIDNAGGRELPEWLQAGGARGEDGA